MGEGVVEPAYGPSARARMPSPQLARSGHWSAFVKVASRSFSGVGILVDARHVVTWQPLSLDGVEEGPLFVHLSPESEPASHADVPRRRRRGALSSLPSVFHRAEVVAQSQSSGLNLLRLQIPVDASRVRDLPVVAGSSPARRHQLERSSFRWAGLVDATEPSTRRQHAHSDHRGHVMRSARTPSNLAVMASAEGGRPASVDSPPQMSGGQASGPRTSKRPLDIEPGQFDFCFDTRDRLHEVSGSSKKNRSAEHSALLVQIDARALEASARFGPALGSGVCATSAGVGSNGGPGAWSIDHWGLLGVQRAGRHPADAGGFVSTDDLLDFIVAHLDWPTPEADAVIHIVRAASALTVGDVFESPPRHPPVTLASRLQARYRAVEFDWSVRRKERAWLAQWCGIEASSISGEFEAWTESELELEPGRADGFACCVWTGPGGVGKTRLMLEWCHALARRGWRAGLARADVDDGHLDELLHSGEDLCLVVDYAESRRGLRALLRRCWQAEAEGGARKIRVILLARALGDWWTNAAGRDAGDDGSELSRTLRATALCSLAEIPPDISTRRAIFETAFRDLTQAGAPVSVAPSDAQLRAPQFGRPLYLLMAAAVAGRGVAATSDHLVAKLLEHEEDRWRLSWGFPRHGCKDRGGDTDYRDSDALELVDPDVEAAARCWSAGVRRVVAGLTLLGGIEGPTADNLDSGCGCWPKLSQLLEATGGPELEGSAAASFAEKLRNWYPRAPQPADASQNIGVHGLEPDLLGEALVLRILSEQGAQGVAPDFLERVLDVADDRQLERAFTMLGRLAARADCAGANVIESWMNRALRGPKLGQRVAAATRALQCLQSGDSPLSRVLYERLQVEDRLDLATVVATALDERMEWAAEMADIAAWAAQTMASQRMREPA